MITWSKQTDGKNITGNKVMTMQHAAHDHHSQLYMDQQIDQCKQQEFRPLDMHAAALFAPDNIPQTQPTVYDLVPFVTSNITPTYGIHEYRTAEKKQLSCGSPMLLIILMLFSQPQQALHWM